MTLYQGDKRVPMAQVSAVDVEQVPSKDGNAFEGDFEMHAPLTPSAMSDDGSSLAIAGPIAAPLNRAHAAGLQFRVFLDCCRACRALPLHPPVQRPYTGGWSSKFEDRCEMHGLIICKKQEEPMAYARYVHACLFTRLAEAFDGPEQLFPSSQDRATLSRRHQ